MSITPARRKLVSGSCPGRDRRHHSKRKGSGILEVLFGTSGRAIRLCSIQDTWGEDVVMDSSFAAAAEGLRDTGASVYDQEIVAMLTIHAKEEEALLQRYERFAEGAASPSTRYLVRLVVEDERRHHRLLGEMANTIAWGCWGDAHTPKVPELFPHEGGHGPVDPETRELLALENQDRAELRRLQKQLKAFKDTTIWSLLVELMMLDTEKHEHILSFISKHSG
jgi:hypothetical protein